MEMSRGKGARLLFSIFLLIFQHNSTKYLYSKLLVFYNLNFQYKLCNKTKKVYLNNLNNI